MRLGGSAPSRILPNFLRSDMSGARWTGCGAGRLRPAASEAGRALGNFGWVYRVARSVDAKMQRRRNAGDDMHPLRFGVSAKIFCERLATAVVVKTKSREVVNLAV